MLRYYIKYKHSKQYLPLTKVLLNLTNLSIYGVIQAVYCSVIAACGVI